MLASHKLVVNSLVPVRSGDSTVQNWINKIGQSNTNQTEVDRLTTFVAGCKSDGSWGLIDRCWIYILGNRNLACATDLANLVVHTEVPNGGTVSWSAGLGFQNGGTNAYLDTNTNLSTLTNFTQNSNHATEYAQSGETSGAGSHRYGGTSAAGLNPDGYSIVRSASNMLLGSTSSSASNVSFAAASFAGMWTIERSASNLQTGFQDGTSIGTSASASTAVANRNAYVLTLNLQGTGPAGPTNAIMGATVYGASGLIGLGFRTRLRTLLNSIAPANYP